MGRLKVDLGLLHELQEVALNPAAGNVGAVHVPGRGDLVDLVQVYDAVLCLLDVAVRLVHQLPHQVFNVAADIAGLAELGRVGLDEGDPDLLGDELDDVGLADAGGPDKEQVALDVAHQALLLRDLVLKVHPVEVGAYLGRDDLDGLFLPHDVLVQEALQLFRFYIEIKLGCFLPGHPGLFADGFGIGLDFL